jgi:hypothetical protein
VRKAEAKHPLVAGAQPDLHDDLLAELKAFAKSGRRRRESVSAAADNAVGGKSAAKTKEIRRREEEAAHTSAPVEDEGPTVAGPNPPVVFSLCSKIV